MAISPLSTPLPLFREQVFIGIDVGKFSHIAAFTSASLLKRYGRFDACPTVKFEQSRHGFEKLSQEIRKYGPPEQCTVLLERTGHYHQGVRQYLQEQGIIVYEIQVQVKQKQKTDKRDALYLANEAYNQIYLGVQVPDPHTRARQVVAPEQNTQLLQCLVRRHFELTQRIVSHKNKLVAICDELCPEIALIFKNVNCSAALAVRERFPLPEQLAGAPIAQMNECRRGHRPAIDDLIRLQRAVVESIGTKNPGRQVGLAIEQNQLIQELRMLQEHRDLLDQQIEQYISETREGELLISLPMVSPLFAAIIMSSIGHISNFEKRGELKAFCGWAPIRKQSGTTIDHSALMKGGNRIMKHTTYILAWLAVRQDTEWREIYQRLVERMCPYDASKKTRVGRNKALGRICGQILGTIYALLKHDATMVANTPEGEKLPTPRLYDREYHRAQRARTNLRLL